MAIVLNEPDAERCSAALATTDELVISAATIAESLIVASRRNVRAEMERLIAGLGFQVIAITHQGAQRAADAYESWGKGLHPAALNFGDCFAYAVAADHSCPLLYVGEDFSKTDVTSVI